MSAAPVSSTAPRRALGPSALSFRFPPRYRVIWGAVTLLLVAIVAIAPDVLNDSSRRLDTPMIAVLVIASLGQLLVVTAGGFDLSAAATMSFASAFLLTFTDGSDGRLVVGLVLVIAASAGIGAVNGVLAGPAGLNPLIVTLAMGGVVGALALLITDQGNEVLNTTTPPALSDVATSYVASISVMLLIAVAIAALVALALRRSTVGRRYVAAGANPRAARIIGVPIARYQVAGYACAGALYGIAGVLLAGFVERPNLTLGDPYLLSTFIVVALGGALFAGGPTSVASTVAGAFFFVWLVHLLAIKGLSAGAQSLVQGVVLVVAVAVVTGLSGRSRRRDTTDAPPPIPQNNTTQGGDDHVAG
ncbi:MAG: ABC transporter permease [Solirubrobacteraceae bacterium]